MWLTQLVRNYHSQQNGSTDTESLNIEDGSSLLGKDLVSWHLESLSKSGVPETHGKGRSITVDMENRG